MIGAGDLTELIGAFKKRPAGHVVVPVVDGQRGNPILLDDVAHAQILASGTNLACRHLIERQPELVHVHETANTRFVIDLDTVEDVQRARRAHRLAARIARSARPSLRCKRPSRLAQTALALLRARWPIFADWRDSARSGTMIPREFDYHAPKTLPDALGLLAQFGDDAKLLAGGHSLLPMMKLRFAQPAHLIDLGRIAELKGIREEAGTLAHRRDDDRERADLVEAAAGQVPACWSRARG